MFLLTERISTAILHKKFHHHGLGFWSDPRTGRTFFYCEISTTTSHPYIFLLYRFDIRESAPQWQCLGQLDFGLIEWDVSPCGFYFWSMDVFPRNQQIRPKQLIFRQINPNTLQYTVFDVTPAGEDNLRSTAIVLFRLTHISYSFQN